MHRIILPVAVLAVGLLLSAGCADLPTQPRALPDAAPTAFDRQQTSATCCDPVIVIVPWCDPYTDPNGCEDEGDCAMSEPRFHDSEQAELTGCGSPPKLPGGGGPPAPREPGPPEPPDTCLTGESIVDDPDVFGGFEALWRASVQQGVERGGWIVQEGYGSYRLIPFQNAAFTACGIDLYESPPAGTVSVIRTRPWPLWSTTPCGYLNTGTPSNEDVSALQQAGLTTGYFLDGDAIGKFTASGGQTAIRIGRCGY